MHGIRFQLTALGNLSRAFLFCRLYLTERLVISGKITNETIFCLLVAILLHRENLEDLQQIVAQLENDRFIASRRAQRLEEELKSQEKVRRKIKWSSNI